MRTKLTVKVNGRVFAKLDLDTLHAATPATHDAEQAEEAGRIIEAVGNFLWAMGQWGAFAVSMNGRPLNATAPAAWMSIEGIRRQHERSLARAGLMAVGS